MEKILKILLVGMGGFLGSMGRYAASGLSQKIAMTAAFPIGTLAVNIGGCLAIGFLAEAGELRGVLHENVRLFLLIGFLGGFTTFSSFGYETMQLLREGTMGLALLNVVLNVVVGVAGVWIGMVAARLVF